MSGNNELVSQFDLSREVSSLYFKSSFARSMFSNSNQSKSLDYVYFDNSTIDEENENETKTPTDDMNIGNSLLTGSIKHRYSNKLFDQQCQNDNFRTISGGKNQNKTSSAFTVCKTKQSDADLPKAGHGDELSTLRKECQRLTAENQRLQQSAAGPHPHPLLLQTQVDTLQWQLKQAESSRQMYRAVLEQVSKFLERVHKNLDQVNGKPPPAKCKARVPRSRSVHTVAGSRPASPSPSPSPAHSLRYDTGFHRANSVMQIQDSHSHSHTLSYSLSRDTSWRSSKSILEEVPPEKLSQEAFRLLRTVQSLLGTQEPDLTHRLTPAPTPIPALSDSSQDTTWSVGSCSSLLPGLCRSSSQRKSLEALSCSGDGEGEGGAGDASTPQLSVGSAEDESGFSSMSSFHEVGLPECRAYPEVGLPLVEPNHRRWSSTPIDNQPAHAIRVLWV